MNLKLKLALCCALIFGLSLLIFAGVWHTGLFSPTLFPPAFLERASSWLEKDNAKSLGSAPESATPFREQKEPFGNKENSAEKTGEIGEITEEKIEKTPAGTSGEISGGTSKSAAGTPNTPENAPVPLRQEIEVYYITKLRTTCGSYEGRLNSLISSALGEYTAARRQGQKVSAVSLARKYVAAGNALERECDAEFYAILADFKAELRKNSFPLDKTWEAQREYERAKAAYKKQILSSASKLF